MTRNQGTRRRLVVVAPNWLGDAVMSLPAIARSFTVPNWDVVIATSPYTARVYWGIDGIAEIRTDGAARRGARIRERARALRDYGADAVAVLPPSFSSALPAWLAGVRKRVGFATDARRLFLTDAVPNPPRSVHLSESYRALIARALDDATSATPSSEHGARIHVDASERAGIDRVLAPSGIARGGYVLVVPGAAFGPAKSWPWERYRQVCERLARDVPVILAGSKADRATCDRVADGIRGVANVAGETTLGEFFALVEGARVALANDSGAPHVAASLGVPTVVLFGSTSPEWTAPLGARVRVLQHKVHCNPCFRRTCPTQLECFNGIPPDDVVASVRAALAA